VDYSTTPSKILNQRRGNMLFRRRKQNKEKLLETMYRNIEMHKRNEELNAELDKVKRSPKNKKYTTDVEEIDVDKLPLVDAYFYKERLKKQQELERLKKQQELERLNNNENQYRHHNEQTNNPTDELSTMITRKGIKARPKPSIGENKSSDISIKSENIKHTSDILQNKSNLMQDRSYAINNKLALYEMEGAINSKINEVNNRIAIVKRELEHTNIEPVKPKLKAESTTGTKILTRRINLGLVNTDDTSSVMTPKSKATNNISKYRELEEDLLSDL